MPLLKKENQNLKENDMAEPAKVVEHMMKHVLFSQWLGIKVLEIREG